MRDDDYDDDAALIAFSFDLYSCRQRLSPARIRKTIFQKDGAGNACGCASLKKKKKDVIAPPLSGKESFP